MYRIDRSENASVQLSSVAPTEHFCINIAVIVGSNLRTSDSVSFQVVYQTHQNNRFCHKFFRVGNGVYETQILLVPEVHSLWIETMTGRSDRIYPGGQSLDVRYSL